MERSVASVRMELAEQGVKLAPEALNEILQAAAHIASYLGGSVTVDTGSFWGLYVEIDKLAPGECWVDLVTYEEDDEDDSAEEMN
jgi:hypothetical protein